MSKEIQFKKAAGCLAVICAFSLFAFAPAARADELSGEYIFVMSSAKEYKEGGKINDSMFSELSEGFQFRFQRDQNNTNSVSLTFELTASAVNLGGEGRDGGIKFKDFAMEGFDNIFVNDNWDKKEIGFTPTTIKFEFAQGSGWAELGAAAESGKILAHIQSLNYKYGAGNDIVTIGSINEAVFSYAPANDGGFSEIPDVPEPGTLLLLGTGIVGLGFAARRKINKKQ